MKQTEIGPDTANFCQQCTPTDKWEVSETMETPTDARRQPKQGRGGNQYTRGEVAKRRGGREQRILFENVTLYNGGSLQVSVEAYLAEKVRLAGVRWRALKSTP